MGWILRVVALALIGVGTIWFLQGSNVLPGSFMTGRPEWAVRGSLAMLAGVALLFVTLRGRRDLPPPP